GRYRQNQQGSGSWGYNVRDPNNLKDATTCCGLIGLAVGHGVQLDDNKGKGDDLSKDPQVERAFKYLSDSLENKAKLNELTEAEIAKRRKHTQDLLDLHKRYYEERFNKFNQDQIQKQINQLDNAIWYKGTYMNADAWGDLYFLWSVERVAVVYDKKKIGN